MPRELILSIFIFLISCLGTFLSYYIVISDSKHDLIFAEKIQNGSHHYLVKNAQGCVGKTSYTFNYHEELSSLKAEGYIKIKYLDNYLLFNYIMDANFNSIGQLGGAILKINENDNFIIFGSTNIDPIKLTFKTNLLAKEVEYNWETAGPVQIIQNADQTFKIKGQNLKSFVGDNLESISRSLIKHMQLQLLAEDNDDILCDEKLDAGLDVTSIVHLLQNMPLQENPL